jgi:polyhydroxyalkanoate synthesis repressor PhaR
MQQKGSPPVSETAKPLLIKRYASRRLYNTESSDYVTLEDIAGFIRGGREVQIIDLKSGDDLTRQYLLQIIADHESRGENVLPLDVLNDLVRSYTAQAQSVVPQFLAMSFEMLREGPGKFAEQMKAMNPMMAQFSKMPGFEAMQRQQMAFLESMVAGWQALAEKEAKDAPKPEASEEEPEDLSEIRRQLAALEAKLARMGR